MIIRNADFYTPEHCFQKGTIIIRGGRIQKITAHTPESPLPGEEAIDASGLYAFPGLVDLHFHGAAGHDFCDADPAGLNAIAEYEALHGILAICPATMTFPEDRLKQVMENAAAFRDREKACSESLTDGNLPVSPSQNPAFTSADLVGINMEGPFISPKKAGAQNPDYIIPASAAMFRRLQENCGGLIRLCDIAPEIPGNIDFIREMGSEIRISLAHTCSDYETAKAAFDAGAKQMTHLYNAMPGIAHRDPGPIIAALEKGADVELIADGVHVHPAMVRFTFNTFGAEHVILISDSMEACGLPDGSYELGGQGVTVKGPKAVLTSRPDTIAGSVTNLYDCMKTAVLQMGVPLEDALRAASENPARAIGIEKDYGMLAPGRFGSVILADKKLGQVMIIRKGHLLRSAG